MQRELGRDPIQVGVEPSAKRASGQQGRGGWDDRGFEGSLQGDPVGKGPVGCQGGCPEEGGFKTEKDRDLVGASRGEGVGPFCEVWGKERAAKGKVKDAGAPYERHGGPGEHARGVEEGKTQVSGPVEVGGQGGDLIFLENPERVSGGVVDVEVSQGEGREGARGENDVRATERVLSAPPLVL